MLRESFRNSKGFTLVEIMVVVAIIGLIAIPIYDIYIRGWQANAKTFRQTNAQDAAVKVMEEICDGFTNNGSKVEGLRGAGAVTFDPPGYSRFAYLAGTSVVSYYLNGGVLYRNVQPYSGSVVINGTGGVQIAGNVKNFIVKPDSGKLVSITLKICQGSDVNTKSDITLATKILPRNLASRE
jgi:prepilin-type N-terminal cleavage/methylation domain-containing protein